MTIHPLFQGLRSAVHVQRDCLAVHDLAHIALGPHGNPMHPGLAVRVCVYDVGGGTLVFLKHLGKSIARDFPVIDTREGRMRTHQMIQLNVIQGYFLHLSFLFNGTHRR